jgi:membrane fusion protein (multidrug efflux system)
MRGKAGAAVRLGACAAMLLFLSGCDASSLRATTAELARVDVLRRVSGVGRIHGLSEATLSADVSGVIRSMPVAEGQEVHKGDLLANLTDQEIEARLAQSQVDLSERESDFKREELLFHRKVISRQRYDDALFALRRAESGHQLYEAQNKKLLITAPFAGTLLRKYREVGETLAFHEKLFLLADLSGLKFSIEVDETDINAVKLGQKVDIALDALTGQIFTGKVTKIGFVVEKKRASLDDATEIMDSKIIYVDAEIAKDPRLRVGLTGIGSIEVANSPGVMGIPRRAVHVERGQAFVEVVEGGRFVRRAVTLGVSDDRYYEIKSGLSAGEKALAPE